MEPFPLVPMLPSSDSPPADGGAPRPAAGMRFPLLDPLRVFASWVVVHTHMRAEFLWGVSFGLFLFLVIMVALASSGEREESIVGFARRKAAYFLSPWVRWSVFYLAVAFLSAFLRDAPPPQLGPNTLLVGGHVSLWFLPFAIVVVVLAKLVQRALRPLRPAVAVGIACAAGIVGTQVAELVVATSGLVFPLAGWVKASPCLAWGVAFGQLRRVGRDGHRRALVLLVVASALAAFAVHPFPGDGADLGRRFLVAVSIASVAFAFRPPVPRSVKFVGTLTFGIYLVHPFVGKVLVDVAEPMSWHPFAHVTLVWFVAGLAVYGIRLTAVKWRECAGPLRPSAAT